MNSATQSPTRPQPEAVTALTARLRSEYGDRALTTHAIREQHSHGEGLADAAMPDIVVFPHTNEEVASIMTHLQSGTDIPIRHWIELVDIATADAPEDSASARSGAGVPR